MNDINYIVFYLMNNNLRKLHFAQADVILCFRDKIYFVLMTHDRDLHKIRATLYASENTPVRKLTHNWHIRSAVFNNIEKPKTQGKKGTVIFTFAYSF